MIKYLFSLIALAISVSINAQTYNYYFGNIHAHSGYSDGNKDSLTSGMSTPIEDFLYAKDSQHIDFYGISEHNHFNAGMNNPLNYHRGLADADSATDANFVAMYGMEWGVIDNGGHVIVYGYDSLVGWDDGYYDVFNDKFDYASLWAKINAKPNAFAYLAHPDFTDYSDLFSNSANLSADNAIVGMAARSGPAFSTNASYSNPASGNYIARYNDALRQGYHLGVGLDHDTHYSVFGRQTKGRLVVLATELTRTAIYNAFRNMRFYSSDDWNCKVNFRVNGEVMGSIITQPGNPTISISVADDDNEAVSSIQVYYGIPGNGLAPTVLTQVSNNATLSYLHTIANGDEFYYYLKITQADGNIIWTSPIWYTRNDAVTANPPVAAFTASVSTACINQNITLTDNSQNVPSAWQWVMPGATPATSSNQNVQISYPATGTYTAYLIATNAYGVDTSETLTITVIPPPVITANSPTICKGDTATLTASGADTYTWSNGATGATIQVTPTASTGYTVTGYTTTGCQAAVNVTVSVQTCTGVKEEEVIALKLFPNPATTYTMLDASSLDGEKVVEVIDIVGKTVYARQSTDSMIMLDVSALAKGSYIVKVSTGKGVYTTYFVK